MIKIVFLSFSALALISQEVRISLLERANKIPLKFSGNFILKAEEAKYQFSKLNEPFYVYSKNAEIILEGKGEYKRYLKFKGDSKLFLYPQRSNSTLYIGKKFKEQGRILIQMTAEKKIQIIAKRSIESYLSYVVPHEILTQNDADFEAIKAQSIAARTYALAHLKKDRSFDLYSDVRDQMYLSNSKANHLVQRAIQETKLQVIRYKNQLIPARFCASLGGQQEYPLYLEEGQKFNAQLSDSKLKTIFGSLSKHYRWKRFFSSLDIFRRLKKWYPNELFETDVHKDQKLSILILKRTRAGRAEKVELRTSNFSKIIEQLDIRRFFQEKSKILPSNLFLLKKAKGGFYIEGAGNGHGLGMGQWEALELARKGYSAEDIVLYFYPKTRIERY